MIDFTPPPKLWLPPKPAIIRAVSPEGLSLIREARRRHKAMFPFPVFCPSSTRLMAYEGTAYNDSAASNTVHTISSVPIGAAASDRVVTVAVHIFDGGAGSRTVSSLTIGGVSATISKQVNATTNSVVIASATVPTGTTANVVVTLNATLTLGSTTSIHVGAWSSGPVVSLSGFSTNNGTTTTATPLSIGPASTPAYGFIIAATTAWNYAASSAFTGFKTTRDYLMQNAAVPSALEADALSALIGPGGGGGGLTLGHTGTAGGGGSNVVGAVATFAYA
jgi:hypothetical protein